MEFVSIVTQEKALKEFLFRRKHWVQINSKLLIPDKVDIESNSFFSSAKF